MSWWTTIFGKGSKIVSEVIDSVGGILDETITNKEELAAAQAKLNKTIMDNSKAFVDARSRTLVAEMSGSWLQRSWRPIVMLMFAFIVVYTNFIGPMFNLKIVPIEARFWDMLELGLGGFIALRSGEKIVSNILVYKKRKRKDDA